MRIRLNAHLWRKACWLKTLLSSRCSLASELHWIDNSGSLRAQREKQAGVPLTRKNLTSLPRYRLGYIARNSFSKVQRTRELSAERLGTRAESVYNRRPAFCRLSKIQAVTRIHALVFIRTVARASEPSAFAFPDRDLEKVSGGTASSGVSTSAVRYKTP